MFKDCFLLYARKWPLAHTAFAIFVDCQISELNLPQNNILLARCLSVVSSLSVPLLVDARQWNNTLKSSSSLEGFVPATCCWNSSRFALFSLPEAALLTVLGARCPIIRLIDSAEWCLFTPQWASQFTCRSLAHNAVWCQCFSWAQWSVFDSWGTLSKQPQDWQ